MKKKEGRPLLDRTGFIRMTITPIIITIIIIVIITTIIIMMSRKNVKMDKAAAAFRAIDTDNSGFLDREEFLKFTRLI